jgi:hypothetical protein
MEERIKRKPKPEPRTASQIFLGQAYSELQEAEQLLKHPETKKEGEKKLSDGLATLKIVLNMAAPKNEHNDELNCNEADTV